jgi:ABC-type sugar transport system ATPase subunit
MTVCLRGVRAVRAGRLVLDVPWLDFAAGRTTVIFGPNGAGKTTLLRLIAALERPSAGSVLVDGCAARRERGGRATVAYAFQEPVFLTGSVRANLELALALRAVPPAARGHRIGEVTEACGLARLLDRPARRLSTGEARRVDLARALALRAPVTLLDEPLAGVDRHTRARLLSELPALLGAFAATTIIVTHDLEEAFRLGDELVVVGDGRVRAAGPKAHVLTHVPDADTAALLGYTVVASNGGVVAIPPDGLRTDAGGTRFQMQVEQVVDLGHRREVWGRVGAAGVRVALAPDGPPPAPGSALAVWAPRVVAFPTDVP